MAVGIAGGIEPVDRQPLAVVRAGKERIDVSLIAGDRGIGQELVHVLGRGRKAGQVESQPSGEGDGVGLGVRPEALGLEPRQDEAVDRGRGPGRVTDRRHLRPLDPLKCPVVLVFGAFLDPAAEHHCLLGRERLANLGGWHRRVGITARDPGDKLA